MLRNWPILLLIALVACAPAAQATATAEVVPTAVPEVATVAPTEAPTAAAEQPVYSDNFADVYSGWFVGVDEFGEAGYLDGGYRIAPPANPGSWSTTDNPTNQSYSDVRVEVDARKLSGPEANEFGLYCRLSGDPSTFYLGLLGSDGHYAIYEHTATEEWEFLDGADAGGVAISAAGSRLRLDCVGSTISFYVDGKLVAEATDSTLTQGETGLYTGTIDETDVGILFDNFAVYLP